VSLSRIWSKRWTARAAPAGVLDQVRRELAGFSNSTESVFLQAGERLGDLQVKARAIGTEAGSIAVLLADETGPVAALDALLNATSGIDKGGDIAAPVHAIGENAEAIQRAIRNIDSAVRTLDVLGMMTRIESSRFSDAGVTFIDLADSVLALSRQIREQLGATATSAASLIETTGSAAEQAGRVLRQHTENLGPLLARTSEGIREVRSRRSQASEASRRLAGRFEEISRAMGDVVSAMQSQDIVRQQIEHVMEAIEKLDTSGASGRAEAAVLQAAQLDNSRATFETSVRQIRESLAGIECHIGELAGESARLLGISGAGGASFFSEVQTNLAGILEILQSNAAADRGLVEAAVSVDHRVSEISQAIAGVRAISIQMQRIAINATIQAAQLGSGGGAMEVVAHAVRSLAGEAQSASDTLESCLNAICAAVEEFDRAAETRGAWEAQIGPLGDGVRDLSVMEGQAQGEHGRAVAMAAELKEQIRETIGAFGTHEESMQSLAGAAEKLRSMAGEAAPAGAANPAEMAARYTMESERDVHRALYQVAAAASPAPEVENIEFF
jgi:methyl-accepting chemotaxis protein